MSSIFRKKYKGWCYFIQFVFTFYPQLQYDQDCAHGSVLSVLAKIYCPHKVIPASECITRIFMQMVYFFCLKIIAIFSYDLYSMYSYTPLLSYCPWWLVILKWWNMLVQVNWVLYFFKMLCRTQLVNHYCTVLYQ